MGRPKKPLADRTITYALRVPEVLAWELHLAGADTVRAVLAKVFPVPGDAATLPQLTRCERKILEALGTEAPLGMLALCAQLDTDRATVRRSLRHLATLRLVIAVGRKWILLGNAARIYLAPR